MNESFTIINLLIGGIALVMLFAQARLFSIDDTLKAILEELKESNRKADSKSSENQ